MSASAVRTVIVERLFTPSIFLFSMIIAPYSPRFGEFFGLSPLDAGHKAVEKISFR
jgi:hypothetical protein